MKEIVKTNKAPAAIGPYSQAVTHNGLIFVSGQLPLEPVSGELSKASIGEQTTLCMNNIKAIVEAAGSNVNNILKTTILLADIGSFADVNAAYGKFFQDEAGTNGNGEKIMLPPARAAYQVAALPKGALVEIEAICAM